MNKRAYVLSVDDDDLMKQSGMSRTILSVRASDSGSRPAINPALQPSALLRPLEEN